MGAQGRGEVDLRRSPLAHAPPFRGAALSVAFLRLTRKYVNLMEGDEDGEAVGVFGLLDPTSSGVASVSELRRLLADAGAQWSEDDVRALVDRIDRCGGGVRNGHLRPRFRPQPHHRLF